MEKKVELSEQEYKKIEKKYKWEGIKVDITSLDTWLRVILYVCVLGAFIWYAVGTPGQILTSEVSYVNSTKYLTSLETNSTFLAHQVQLLRVINISFIWVLPVLVFAALLFWILTVCSFPRIPSNQRRLIKEMEIEGYSKEKMQKFFEMRDKKKRDFLLGLKKDNETK